MREKRKNEVEEIVIGQIEGVDDPIRKKDLLADKKEYDGPSKFNNGDDDEEMEFDTTVPTYDSDSSEDEEIKISMPRGNDRLHPHQLPSDLPEPLIQTNITAPMYKCQIENNLNEESLAKFSITENGDIPLRAPFLHEEAPLEGKVKESNSWMLFKFPTRIPNLKSGNLRENKTGVKVEDAEGDSFQLESFSESVDDTKTNNETSSSITFDDTFKNTRAGKYGKIIMYKSGKTFLVLGEDENQIKMQISEGIQCGFYQQAVCIDPMEAKYIPLGEVKKSLVVTPNIDGENM